jgi:hypothetical protein
MQHIFLLPGKHELVVPSIALPTTKAVKHVFWHSKQNQIVGTNGWTCLHIDKHIFISIATQNRWLTGYIRFHGLKKKLTLEKMKPSYLCF